MGVRAEVKGAIRSVRMHISPQEQPVNQAPLQQPVLGMSEMSKRHPAKLRLSNYDKRHLLDSDRYIIDAFLRGEIPFEISGDEVRSQGPFTQHEENHERYTTSFSFVLKDPHIDEPKDEPFAATVIGSVVSNDSKRDDAVVVVNQGTKDEPQFAWYRIGKEDVDKFGPETGVVIQHVHSHYKIRENEGLRCNYTVRRADEPVKEAESEVTIELPSKAKEELKARGLEILTLSGKTIAEMVNEASGIYPNVAIEDRRLRNLPSIKMEVAIDPDHPLIPGSNNKTVHEQLQMIAEYSNQLQIVGVTAVMATEPIYIDLLAQHLTATGQKWFSDKFKKGGVPQGEHGLPHARTISERNSFGYDTLCVRLDSSDRNAPAEGREPSVFDSIYAEVYAMPVIVPDEALILLQGSV